MVHLEQLKQKPNGRVPVAQLRVGPQAARLIERKTGKHMSLVTIVLTLIVVGVLLWLANTYIPMDGKIKKVLNIVVMVVVVLWLLNVFGVLSYLRNVRASIESPTLAGYTCCVVSPDRAHL
jgi:hypothetical protein